ncbi:MAG TPA: hypothetical protein VLS89_06920 [Candidatus Nanopelagicales bacterium]|nr:hypothetical protein [Candidatus Nanopelagicales bacterium]
MLLSIAGVSGGAAGCWAANRVDIYTCDDPCGNGQPGHTCDNPCGPCVGQCIPIPPLDFDGPMILYIGPKMDAPECPAHAPVNAYEGFADLVDGSQECPPCACSEPACVLPEGVTASTLNACPNDGPGATLTEVSAPTGWGGECVSPGTVDPSLLGSVTIAPVTVRPCEVVPQPVPTDWDFDPLWKTFARACRGQVDNGRCADPGLICMPTAEPPPPGFRQCIAYIKDADPGCPETYPDKFTFYAGVDDTRGCTECSCVDDAPSTCVASMSAYQSATCSSPLFADIPVDSASSPCVDTMAGLQLTSIRGEWLVNEPGSCAPSGGVPFGEVIPAGPKVFCCQPPP